MKKLFEEPIIEVEKFQLETIMTELNVSEPVIDDGYDDNWTPII